MNYLVLGASVLVVSASAAIAQDADLPDCESYLDTMYQAEKTYVCEQFGACSQEEQAARYAHIKECKLVDERKPLTLAQMLELKKKSAPVAVSPKPQLTSASPAPAAGRRAAPRIMAGAVAVPEAFRADGSLVVTFALNSARLTDESQSSIDRWVKLSRGPGDENLAILIAGHTDSRGAEAYNLDLSQQRAEAVKAAFAERGIPVETMEARGFGSSEPLDGYKGTHGLNRRVHVSVKKPAK